jgi:hypothetical protein
MSQRRYPLFAAALASFATQADAQFFDELLEHKTDVFIEHAAELPLRLSAIALANPEGRCADSILGRIESDFVQSGVAVVDRAQLNQVLREQNLQVSGLVNEKSAARVGQLLGAQALIFLKVSQCTSTRSAESFRDKKGKVLHKYTTLGTIRGLLRIVDLTTGRVLVSRNLEDTGGLEDWSGYPPADEVLAQREVALMQTVHQMLLPWREKRSVVVYDDQDCDLIATYKLMKILDLDAALASSEAAVAKCKGAASAKKKVLGRAYYNLGLVQFLRNDYAAATASLSEAAKYQDGGIVTELLAESRVAQQRSGVSYPSPVAAQAGSLTPKGNGPPVAPATPPGAPSAEERLKQLESLKQKGMLTKDEYDRKRAQIIGEL